MLGLPPPTVVLPAAVAEATRAMLAAFTALDGNPMACELRALAPGGEHRLPGHVVRPFATFHPVPSQARAGCAEAGQPQVHPEGGTALGGGVPWALGTSRSSKKFGLLIFLVTATLERHDPVMCVCRANAREPGGR